MWHNSSCTSVLLSNHLFSRESPSVSFWSLSDNICIHSVRAMFMSVGNSLPMRGKVFLQWNVYFCRKCSFKILSTHTVNHTLYVCICCLFVQHITRNKCRRISLRSFKYQMLFLRWKTICNSWFKWLTFIFDMRFFEFCFLV